MKANLKICKISHSKFSIFVKYRILKAVLCKISHSASKSPSILTDASKLSTNC